MNWNLESHRVHAKYMGKFPISGIVALSRVKYGGGVSHHVVLDEPINVYGAERDRVIIDHDQIERVTSWSILGNVS